MMCYYKFCKNSTFRYVLDIIRPLQIMKSVVILHREKQQNLT